jgi:hypothetical protein
MSLMGQQRRFRNSRFSQKSLNRWERQLGIADGVLDVLVAEVGLQGARIVALICKREAAGYAGVP